MKYLTCLLLVMSLQNISVADPSLENTEEYKIGVMVKAIAEAMKTPEDKESLKTITAYGHDTRYYTMIRGWLVQELRNHESLLSAYKNKPQETFFQLKVNFLLKVIRRIDLE